MVKINKNSSGCVVRRKPLNAGIGIIGVGHDVYGEQFAGLLDELKRKLEIFEDKIKTRGVRVKNFGIIDNALASYRALPEIKAANLYLLFIDMLTYTTSSTFGVIINAGGLI